MSFGVKEGLVRAAASSIHRLLPVHCRSCQEFIGCVFGRGERKVRRGCVASETAVVSRLVPRSDMDGESLTLQIVSSIEPFSETSS